MFSSADLNIQPVLLETKNRDNFSILSYSAILLQEKYVISTSHILQDVFEKITVPKSKAGKLFVCGKEVSEYQQFKVVTSNFRKSASLFAYFKCKNVTDFFLKDCKDFDVQRDGANECSTNLKEFISVFLIFYIKRTDCSEDNLKMALHSWAQAILKNTYKRGEKIWTVSSPFGNRIFFNTMTEGIVSNTFRNSTMFLSDCCSAPGSEGAPVFNSKSCDIPIGIIISPFNWWRRDWVGFTLIADIKSIILQILDADKDLLVSDVCRKILSPSQTYFENSVAQICCGVNWGSCILLNQSKGIFLTNSHVVNPNFKITILCKNERVLASLIYQSAEHSPLDIAVVQIRKNIHCLISEVDISKAMNRKVNKGDPVYCVGYPLFSTYFKPQTPTITKGIVSAVSPYMIKTTCSVYPGFSGGGVFSLDGTLVGIIVCNTRIPDFGVVHPRINMAVPFRSVANEFIQFLHTGDVSKLRMMDHPDSEASRSWVPLEAKL